MKITEGRLHHGGMTTVYWVAEPEGTVIGPPLIVAHGGPGCTHDYLLSLTDLVQTDRRVVFYDQAGNGASSHHPDLPASRWSVELFLDELDALINTLGCGDGYDLLGQSWGGMLAAEHAVRQPPGLRRLIIANSPASMPRWRRAAAALRDALPSDVRQALEEHEATGTIDSEAYRAASDVFYARHVCRVVPHPPEVAATFAWVDADPTVYRAMNGPTEFHVIGSLRDWSIEERLSAIAVPTLVLNGRHDEATDDTIEPFLRRIRDVRYHCFKSSSHMPHWEEREEYMAVVGTFLDVSTPRQPA